MLHDIAWVRALDCKPLLDFLNVIMPEGGECVSAGGDFVSGGDVGSKYQRLHSDIGPWDCESDDQVEQLCVPFPPPYISANIAVQHIGSDNGPMRIIPGSQTICCTAYRERVVIPSCTEEPESWLASVLQPMHPGDILVRDVRVLHGGTPNRSLETRFLPSLEFATRSLRNHSTGEWPARWEMQASLPMEHYKCLSEQARAWCSPSIVSMKVLDIGWR